MAALPEHPPHSASAAGATARSSPAEIDPKQKPRTSGITYPPIIGLLAVFTECPDRNDRPVYEPNSHHELVWTSVVRPRFDRDLSSDRVRLAAYPYGICAALKSALRHSRATTIRSHGRNGITGRNEHVAATHGIAPRVLGGNST